MVWTSWCRAARQTLLWAARLSYLAYTRVSSGMLTKGTRQKNMQIRVQKLEVLAQGFGKRRLKPYKTRKLLLIFMLLFSSTSEWQLCYSACCWLWHRQWMFLGQAALTCCAAKPTEYLPCNFCVYPTCFLFRASSRELAIFPLHFQGSDPRLTQWQGSWHRDTHQSHPGFLQPHMAPCRAEISFDSSAPQSHGDVSSPASTHKRVGVGTDCQSLYWYQYSTY